MIIMRGNIMIISIIISVINFIFIVHFPTVTGLIMYNILLCFVVQHAH